uniref:Uncharacterized protein n=1 Tax=Gossypium raimondii TaxID=29730 RepID=A0A0D2PVZ1_GOSRA|nr:hypothetical protein B456_001G079600 [Gossypium raimondii]
MYPRNCTLLMSIVLNMYMFQVRENDIWNDLDRHNLMQNVGSDHTTYVYMKRRAIETIVKLLETRTNLHGLQEFKCPDALAEHYKPLTCRFRELVSKHSLIIMPICAEGVQYCS